MKYLKTTNIKQALDLISIIENIAIFTPNTYMCKSSANIIIELPRTVSTDMWKNLKDSLSTDVKEADIRYMNLIPLDKNLNILDDKALTPWDPSKLLSQGGV